MIHRAKTKDVHALMIDGEIVYRDGRFTRIDHDEILSLIAEVMARPRDAEEQERSVLRAQVFPEVEKFYVDCMTQTAGRLPFYQSSSRT